MAVKFKNHKVRWCLCAQWRRAFFFPSPSRQQIFDRPLSINNVKGTQKENQILSPKYLKIKENKIKITPK